jgi:hypothetical protein
MAGVAQELEFIAVEAIAAVGCDVQKRIGYGDCDQNEQVNARFFGARWFGDRGSALIGGDGGQGILR